MGGSKTITYKDLQVQKLMDDPEKAYKASMRQAYKNVSAGMRAVIREYQQGIVDTRSLFNDSYLTNLGYNPKENIQYLVVDPILVLNWLKANVNTNISKVVSYKWGVPSLEEIALEYLQDTYSGMVLVDKSFLISGVRWYVSGVTNVSTTMTNATCYKDRNVTAQEYATANGVVISSIEDKIYTIKGINYWKVTLTTGVIINVPVEYTTIECPGVGSDVVQTIIAEYNGKEYPVQSVKDLNGKLLWTNTVKVSAYINSDGDVKVTGTALKPTYKVFNSSRYLEATKEAVANIVEQVEKEIELDLNEELDRLIATYELNGVQKLKLAEIDKELVSSIANASAYPVIPLRENYAFVKETRQMKAVLNKLGMAADDFETSLNNSKIKNAAIMFLIDLKDESAVGTKVVYETLVNMVRTVIPASVKVAQREEYQLNLRFSDVNMKTIVNFGLSTKAGIVAEVGKYVRYSRQVKYTETEKGGGADQSWTSSVTRIGTIYGIRKQVSESYYEEMEFGSCSTKWKVGGYELDGVLKLGQNDGEIYIPITDLGLNGLTYEELHYAIARGMSMMALSIVKVKTKWYQSGFFKFVMIVAIAVAAFFTGGAALAAYGPLAAALVYTGAAVSILGVMGVNTSLIGQIIQVAAVIFGGYTSLTSATATSGQQTLAVASTLTSLASTASQINLQGTLAAIENKRSAKQAELEASEEQLEEIADNTQQGLWMGIQDRDPELLYAMSSTAMMCNYDILYDYDGLIDRQITSVGI